ncbi:MAG TPA: helix-turn-helix domain-containing protein [Trebonia sp.]|jgi:excisionase family DNA binding protein
MPKASPKPSADLAKPVEVAERRPRTRTDLAKPAEVADYLGIPDHTLAQWRYRGIGPRYSRVGRHIRYRWSDVERWLDENATDPADVA